MCVCVCLSACARFDQKSVIYTYTYYLFHMETSMFYP